MHFVTPSKCKSNAIYIFWLSLHSHIIYPYLAVAYLASDKTARRDSTYHIVFLTFTSYISPYIQLISNLHTKPPVSREGRYKLHFPGYCGQFLEINLIFRVHGLCIYLSFTYLHRISFSENFFGDLSDLHFIVIRFT